MRFECTGCKKSFSGSGLVVALNGKQLTYCADCLWKLRKEYDKKKTCEDCGYFDEESCKKTSAAVVPVKIGYNTYFVEAETCKDYSTEKKANPDKKKEKELTPTQKEAACPRQEPIRERTKPNILLLPLRSTAKNRRKSTRNPKNLPQMQRRP